MYYNICKVKGNLISLMLMLTVSTFIFGQSESLLQINNLKSELEAYKEEGNQQKVAEFCNRIAYSYWQADNLQEAINYFNESVNINKLLGNQNALRIIYGNLGLLYYEKNSYTKAIEFFELSMDLNLKSGKKEEATSDQLNIALSYYDLRNFDASNIHAEKALSKSLELNNLSITKSCYELLAKNHEVLGNQKKSAEYYENFASISRHLQKKQMENLENQSKQYEQQAIQKDRQLKNTLDTLDELKEEKSEALLRIELINKENKLKELAFKEEHARMEAREKLRRNQLIMLSIALLLFLSIMILVYLQFRNKKTANLKLQEQNQEIEKQKLEIEKQRDLANRQKKKITDSIQYARRIQSAVLPPPESLQSIFHDSFILYRPKDIVSGDFYWVTQKDNLLIVAAADCTGHGVPGAFMSMLGVAYLNEIVNKIAINKHINSLTTDEILNQLREMVIASLRQTGHRNEPKDGMDIALCIIDLENKSLQFSGANNPLYILRKGQLIQLDADKMPVSYHSRKDTAFQRSEIDLLDNDCIYLFSDGFIDQFGGEKGLKFMRNRFKEILLRISDLPMEKQKEELEKTFDEWRGEWHQLDDILVMGFRFTTTKMVTTSTQYNWPDKTLLLAEDTDINFFLLVEALRNTNAKIVRVKNGVEAVDFIKSNEVDLILMDINMPVMNGFDATKQIKRYRKDIPIIVQTAMNFKDEKEKALEAGADDYVAKPIDLKSFLKKLSKFLN